jgi:hypothetical protein
VTGNADPETYLRLACERFLLSRSRQGGSSQGGELASIGRALVAGGLLDKERVKAVLEEYSLAFGLREHGGWWRVRRMHIPEMEGRPLSAQRVAICNLEFGADRHMTLERIVFGDDATHLDLSGVGPSDQGRAMMPFRPPRMARGRMGPGGLPHGSVLIVRDDQGTTASASFGRGGSGGREWHGQFTTDKPLSAGTAWIEIDGARLALPERRPAADVRIEAVEPTDPVRSMLYREILGSGQMHGDDSSIDVAIEALVATGALRRDDAIVGEVQRVATAFTSGRKTPNLPPPWAALLRRMSKADGPIGTLTIGSVVESLEKCSIRFDSLTSEEDSFSVAIAVSPGWPLLMHFPGFRLERSPIDWWAEDDRDNTYVLVAGGNGGSDGIADGTVHSLAPLDPKAKVLRLLPTGASERAVVTVPLVDLRGG